MLEFGKNKKKPTLTENEMRLRAWEFARLVSEAKEDKNANSMQEAKKTENTEKAEK